MSEFILEYEEVKDFEACTLVAAAGRWALFSCAKDGKHLYKIKYRPTGRYVWSGKSLAEAVETFNMEVQTWEITKAMDNDATNFVYRLANFCKVKNFDTNSYWWNELIDCYPQFD